MKRTHNSHYHRPHKWVMLILIVTIYIILVLLLFMFLPIPLTKPSSSLWLSSKLNFIEEHEANLPKFAYLLIGTKGDRPQLKRVLKAVYHPRNYLLHLDLEAPNAERLDLAKFMKSESVFAAFRNVLVVDEADLVTYKGPTMIASTLHRVALLLKRVPHWDWFVNLSASYL